MILDASLILSDTQTTTTNAASTDYIDTLAAGNDYAGCWFNVAVNTTAFKAGLGAPAINFQLQTADNTSFAGARTSVFTLNQSGDFLVAQLTASTLVYKCRIPPGALRYIRGYKYINNYAANTIYLSACSYDMFITMDSDVTRDPQ